MAGKSPHLCNLHRPHITAENIGDFDGSKVLNRQLKVAGRYLPVRMSESLMAWKRIWAVLPS
jgi:hypothetical protein